GCYGARRPTSPSLDAFARSALLYETAYSQCSWTLPSTATILTGLHPDVHGVLGREAAWLHDEDETLAEALAARGFTCGAVVSNALVSPTSNFQQGFETFRGVNWANARKVVGQTLGWLDEHAHDRVFAYLHFVDPHAPYEAPIAAKETFRAAGSRFAEQGFDELIAQFESPRP